MKQLTIDIETASDEDISECGVIFDSVTIGSNSFASNGYWYIKD